MKNLLLFFAGLLCFVLLSSQKGISQGHRTGHEIPVIADAVQNIPEELIEGGKLSNFAALSVPDDVRWNPDSVELNANGAVFALTGGNSFRSCFIGGHFTTIGGRPANGLAFYDDELKTFSEIGGGINGDVYAIVLAGYSGGLYVAGNFTKAGNVEAHNIAHWTGSTWEALGSGTDSTVLALAFISNTLYVGGNFRTAGGQPANFIARWDTTAKRWSPILDGNTNGMNGGVAAITLGQFGNIFIGGGFTMAGAVSAKKIAVYNGAWSNLIEGVDGPNAMVSVITPEGIVGGRFQSAGGLLMNNIAAWDGYAWGQVPQFPGGFDGPVYAISTSAEMYVGGDFHKGGSIPCNFILQTGHDRSPVALGSGLDGPCYTLIGKILYVALPLNNFQYHFYIGGEFSTAGSKPSHDFAIWGEEGFGSVQETASFRSQVSLRISPDPVRTSSNISYSLPDRAFTSLSVTDALGREVLSLGSRWQEAGPQHLPLEAGNLPNGFYYCHLAAEGQSVCSSFVVIR